MTAETAEPEATYRWQHWSAARACSVWLAVLLGMALVWALAVLVPYYVNDLHRLPLAEVASGAHDPKDLWPYAPEVVLPFALVRLVGLYVVALAPGAAVISVLGGVLVLAAKWRTLTTGGRVLAFAVVLASLALATLTLSPFGQALTTWYMD